MLQFTNVQDSLADHPLCRLFSSRSTAHFFSISQFCRLRNEKSKESVTVDSVIFILHYNQYIERHFTFGAQQT